MRLVASAIALLAISILIQPFASRYAEGRGNSATAASCWEHAAADNVRDIAHRHLVKQIMTYILKETPDSKIQAEDVGKKLQVVVGSPNVERIDNVAKGADCRANVHIQYGSGEAESLVQFSVNPSADGSSVSIRTAAIDQLFQELDQSLAKVK